MYKRETGDIRQCLNAFKSQKALQTICILTELW